MDYTHITIGDDHYRIPQEWVDIITNILKKVAVPDTLTFPLYLTNAGPRKIAVIKELRAILDCALLMGKQMADMATPSYGTNYVAKPVLVKHCNYEEGMKIKRQLEEAGATVQFASPLELLAREAD